MGRAAVFVDAGYVYAAGSKLIAGGKLPRSSINLDARKIRSSVFSILKDTVKHPALRIYWYDGTSSGPTPQHLVLAYLEDVKLRLGMVNNAGQQKGVDSLIVTDMIALARNRAMSDALLISGDEDVRVGVQQAQEFGVRVHLPGIEPASGNQSNLLRQEADTTLEWRKGDVEQFLSCQIVDNSNLAVEAIGSLEQIAEELAASLSDDEKNAVSQSAKDGQVPAGIDGKLLVMGAKALQVDRLLSKQKRKLRTAFLTACENLGS